MWGGNRQDRESTTLFMQKDAINTLLQSCLSFMEDCSSTVVLLFWASLDRGVGGGVGDNPHAFSGF